MTSAVDAWIILYLVGVIVFAAVTGSYRPTDKEVFALSSYKTSSTASGLSIFATLSSESAFFFAIALTQRFGVYGILAPTLGTVLGLIVLALSSRRAYQLARSSKYVTTVDALEGEWPTLSSAAARVVLCIFLFWIVVLQIRLNTDLLEAVASWSPAQATIVSVSVVLLYMLLGGYRAVTATDIFQSIFILIVLLCPFVLTVEWSTVLSVPQHVLRPGSIVDMCLLACMSFTLTIARPELWQRVFSASSFQSVRTAFFAGALLYLLFILSLAVLAYAIIAAMPAGSTAEMFSKGYGTVLPGWMTVIFPVILLAAMMSTLDSAAFALSARLADIAGATGLSFSTRTRIGIVIVLVLGACASPFVADVLTMAYFINGFASVVAIIVVSLFILKERTGLALSFWLGIVTVVILGATGAVTTNQSLAILGSLVSIGALIVARWFGRRCLLDDRNERI